MFPRDFAGVDGVLGGFLGVLPLPSIFGVAQIRDYSTAFVGLLHFLILVANILGKSKFLFIFSLDP